MATYQTITHPADPRLDDYLRLRDTQLRHRIETERGLYIAEGEKIIRRALAAGHQPRSLLLAPRWIDGLADLIDPLEVEVLVAPEALTEQATGFHVHRGALAAMQRPEPTPLSDLLVVRRLVVVQDLVDHANLGAIIRDAAGLGWDGLLLSAGSADPYYRRAVKASMGTVFSLPWARLDADQGPEALREAGFTVIAMALTDQAQPISQIAAELDPAQPAALLLGSEGPGLSPAWLAASDRHCVIPMHRGVDSLTVAAAAAIACHTLLGSVV